ncbi:mRNA triphosphatase CET1 [Xylariaceae sp. FL1019]|nr:mRNA triphosphatase CET1 [Xylariaceae sp. FL1019]
MDLRKLMNSDGAGGGSDRSKASRPPPPPPPPPPSISTAVGPVTAAPATPVQSGHPSHAFRDYSHSTHASPVAQLHEYPPSAGPGPPPYASPTSYHPQPGSAYGGRPSVPPLQPLASHDTRSPGSISGPSPYQRQTPTSSISTGSGGGYPFPAQQPPPSPGQRHQYPPSHSYSRDSYQSQTPTGVPPSHGSVSYGPGQSHPQQHSQQHLQQQQPQHPVAQTPPVGTPGGSHQYLQQRSMSIHSTPTPTSAHSQPPSFPVYGSPVATHHPHPANLDQQQHHQHNRHQSPQPPTPLGPPMAPRQSPAMSYQQPPSPYQQRISQTSTISSYQQQMMQTSPPPPPPSAVSRMPSIAHSAYDAAGESQRRSQSLQSRGERERSLSVSPKTRVPSLPSSTDDSFSHSHSKDAQAQAYAQYNHNHNNRLQPQLQHPSAAAAANLGNNSIATSMERMEPQRDLTPAKRKMDDRDLRPDEVENLRQPPPPPKLNGNHTSHGNPGSHNHAAPSAAAPSAPSSLPRSSASPVMARKKRVVHRDPPAWAQSGHKRPPGRSRNFSIKNPTSATPSSHAVNGVHHEPHTAAKVERFSRHSSPEAARSTTIPAEEPNHSHAVIGSSFPWEPSIENTKPIDVISRSVGDFFYGSVLKGPNADDLRARGAQFEIEAKLGNIIDKATNDRLCLPGVSSGEIVVDNEARIAFKSSMTPNQHRFFNNYLNDQVKASFPGNPAAAGPRVQVHYVHRRETDRFFELLPEMRQRLPASVANLLSPHAPLKARVTYDQKTNNVLAKIVKARVANHHIHMPHLHLDCRISVNIEWDWDGPAEEIEQNQIPKKERPPDRKKDRLSYKQGFYQVDLTQVTQPTLGPRGEPGPPSKEHELEIELDSKVLLEHGRRLINREENRYTDLVDGFIDNIRLLARRCADS